MEKQWKSNGKAMENNTAGHLDRRSREPAGEKASIKKYRRFTGRLCTQNTGRAVEISIEGKGASAE
jgi:hypothetical protein